MEREKMAAALSAIGLSKTEADVYIFVSANPEAGAAQVAKDLHIARSKAYDALSKLVSMGLVSKISRENDKGRFYSSGSSVLKGIYHNKMKDLGDAIDYMGKITTMHPGQTRIKIVEGLEGYKLVKESFFSRLSRGGEMLVIGSPVQFGNEELDRYIRHFDLRREEHIARLRHTKCRYLPKNNAPAWVEIYGGSIMIPLFSDTILTIAITDVAVSTNFRNFFEVMWESAKKI
jgi:predicted transcriptional regulator